MKKQSLLPLVGLIIILLSCSCGHANKTTNKEDEANNSLNDTKNLNLTSITFNNKVFDFGNVSSDTTIVATYSFSNSGDTTLIIDYVNPDCICTDYSISSKIIEPGEKGYINLILYTKGKVGLQKINATIKANTENRFHLITLKGVIQ